MKLKFKYDCNFLESLAPPVRMHSAQLSGQMVFCLPPTASCFLSCLKTAELRMQAKQFYLGLGRRFPLLLLIKAHWERIQLWRGALRKNYFSSCCREPGQTLTSHGVLFYAWASFPVPTSAHHLLLQNELEWQAMNNPGDLLVNIKSSRFPTGVIHLFIVLQSFSWAQVSRQWMDVPHKAWLTCAPSPTQFPWPLTQVLGIIWLISQLSLEPE